MFGISVEEAARKIKEEENSLMRRSFTHYGRHVGVALAIIAHVFDPETIVIGGGVSKAWSNFGYSSDYGSKDLCVQKRC